MKRNGGFHIVACGLFFDSDSTTANASPWPIEILCFFLYSFILCIFLLKIVLLGIFIYYWHLRWVELRRLDSWWFIWFREYLQKKGGLGSKSICLFEYIYLCVCLAPPAPSLWDWHFSIVFMGQAMNDKIWSLIHCSVFVTAR